LIFFTEINFTDFKLNYLSIFIVELIWRLIIPEPILFLDVTIKNVKR
jgi:hypothetical protein